MEKPSRPLTFKGRSTSNQTAKVPNKGGRKPRVLFLCDGKSAWSGLAASILKEKAGSFFDIYAATCNHSDHTTKKLLKKLDMESICCVEAMQLSSCNHLNYDYLIALTPSALANTKALPLHDKFIPWNIEDESYPERQINEQLNYLLSLYLYQ
ncbi:hypothetical protein [Vibrio nigripulchritudo]|uniref:hypothetical protein n=1 Tax=Vibrio nigripulchritudo TaxID=28173 RepID=UPI0005FA4254|nr:hypothetical protein [Vibrio nigripulchritudo]KJY67838.1 hypothetical protein TW74_26210 [Vibrio nigripulchritudo]